MLFYKDLLGIEQVAFNQLVPRSSRGRPTKNGALREGLYFSFPQTSSFPTINPFAGFARARKQ